MAEKEATKDWLMRAWRTEDKVRELEHQVAVLKDRLSAVRASHVDGMPRGGRRPDWTEAADALTDETRAMEREITGLCARRREVRDVIRTVRPDLYRELLEYRYLCYLPWPRVAERMGYEERYIYKLHNKALGEVNLSGESPKDSGIGQ